MIILAWISGGLFTIACAALILGSAGCAITATVKGILTLNIIEWVIVGLVLWQRPNVMFTFFITMVCAITNLSMGNFAKAILWVIAIGCYAHLL